MFSEASDGMLPYEKTEEVLNKIYLSGIFLLNDNK